MTPTKRVDLRVVDTMLRAVANRQVYRDDNFDYYDELTGRTNTDAVYAAEDRGWVMLHRDGTVSLTVDGERRIRAKQANAPLMPAFSGDAA